MHFGGDTAMRVVARHDRCFDGSVQACDERHVGTGGKQRHDQINCQINIYRYSPKVLRSDLAFEASHLRPH